MRNSLLFILALASQLLWAQPDNPEWWNNRHNWDGVSTWNSYMKLVPGATGPNALPVPELRNGSLDTSLSLLTAAEVHWAPNDFTANLFLDANFSIKNVVGIQIWWVPVEVYQTDSVVRDFRVARGYEGKGWSIGDVYIATTIPLLSNHKTLPDMLLGINLKTASGNNLEDARFTDTPGYYFDLSFGKTYPLFKNCTIRPHAMGGFFVYQTYRNDYNQNDAVMWGLGADFSYKTWHLSTQLTGYAGYFGELDTPVAFRAEMNRKFTNTNIFVRYQIGNMSYPFQSIRAGARLFFKKR